MPKTISTRMRPLVCLSALFSAIEPQGQIRSSPVSGGLRTIHLLAFNDLHGAIATGQTRGGRPIGGAAYLAAHLAQRRAMHPGQTLTVHGGDLVSASPAISGLLQDEPAVAVANAIGCDLGVVGNHEFDEGVPELFRLLNGGAHPITMPMTGRFPGSRIPTLAANVVSAKTRQPLLRPYQIMTVQGIKIGFIGVVTTDTASGIGLGVEGLTFLPEAATVNHYVGELRAKGVGVIVVLAHLGGIPTAPGQLKGPVVDFAKQVDPAVDVILSAHTHRSYCTTIDGKLVTQAAPYGVELADVALTLDHATGRVVRKGAALLPVWNDEVAPDPAVSALVDRYAGLAASLTRQRIGVVEHAITRQYDDAGEQALGELIADAYRWRLGADLAIAHPGWNWADLAAGDVSLGDLYLVQPANYQLITARMTGAQIVAALEQQWLPERTRLLQVSGLVVDVDPTAPLGRRVQTVRLTDRGSLVAEDSYSVAISSFLAGGADGFAAFCAARDLLAGPKDLATLTDYVHRLAQPFEEVSAGQRKRRVAAARHAD